MPEILILSAPAPALPWLRGHPGVRLSPAIETTPNLRFRQGDWEREISIGEPSVNPSGLIELIDNNPLVCADYVSVPDPWSALALIAFGPLARASMLPESPVLISSLDDPKDPELVRAFLLAMGGPDGGALQSEPGDLGSVVAATGWAVIPTPERMDDLDDLYTEAYGRSFFIHEADDDHWAPDVVQNTSMAYYKLAIAPTEEPSCLIRIQVLADVKGKLGAAQLIHALNVMVGFEESLGLDPAPTLG